MKKRIFSILVLCVIIACTMGIIGIIMGSSAKEFTITYDLDGGEFDSNSHIQPRYTYIDGEAWSFSSEATPLKTGYNFVRWEDENGEEVSSVAMKKGNLNLKAVWELKEYSVTIMLDTFGVSHEPIQTTIKYGDEYDFSYIEEEGWTVEGLKHGDEILPLKGVWEYDFDYHGSISAFQRFYEITFHTDGGVLPYPGATQYTETYSPLDDPLMYAPRKSGYYFDHYTYDEEGLEIATAENILEKKTAVDLYAHYGLKKYYIRVFDTVSGDQYITLQFGEPYSFKEASEHGKVFVGYEVRYDTYYKNIVIPAKGVWNFDSISLDSTESLSLDPIFRDYQFVYNLNGGANDENNPITLEDGRSFTLLPASREYSEFEGWYTSDTYSYVVTSISSDDIKNSDYNLYAKFSGKKSLISLDLDGAECPELTKKKVTYHYITTESTNYMKEVVIDKGETLPIFYPSMGDRLDKCFVRWYKDSACTVPFNYDEEIKTDMDLYAGYFTLEKLTSPSYWRTKTTILPYNYSVVDGTPLSKYQLTNNMSGYPRCLCFTAEYTGKIKIYYQGSDSTASFRLSIENRTDYENYKLEKVTYSQYDTTLYCVEITAKKGDFIIIELNRRLTTDKEGSTASVNFYFEGNFQKPVSTAIGSESAYKVLEYGAEIPLPELEKDGYTFEGWALPDGTIIDLDEPWNGLEDTTLKAVFTANK